MAIETKPPETINNQQSQETIIIHPSTINNQQSTIPQIDLEKHALIEASAGTGKTYTIENLVVRLLEEREDLGLENILLVTFTEKATSELKMRIREKIEKTIENRSGNPRAFRRLQDALDIFDRAPIHTIHGFCQTVLRDFAFENQTVFQSEVIEDRALYDILLKEQMRSFWPKEYGKDLKKVLRISGFHEKKEAFLETVSLLGRTLREAFGDKLLPDLQGEDFTAIEQEIHLLEQELGVLFEAPGAFSSRYEQLNFNKAAKNSILQKIVQPLEDHFHSENRMPFDTEALLKLLAQIQGTVSSERKGIDCLLPTKWNKGEANLHVCPSLEALQNLLRQISKKAKELECSLALTSIRRLQQDVALTKRRLGRISYDDMLSLVEQAICAENASVLLEKLRERYRVAFIDEFQDTDPVQWRIFKRLYLEDSRGNPSNRLFLIGDPKQAIYSFRGADVYTYLEARNLLAALSDEGKAGLYSLSTNWRSEPDMIQTFNDLFCREIWFRPQETAGRFEIGYAPSKAPVSEVGFPMSDVRDQRSEVGGQRSGSRHPRFEVRGLTSDIRHPTSDIRRSTSGRVLQDDSGRQALTIFDLSLAPSPGPAKIMLARMIGREIEHLLSCSIRMREKSGEERTLTFADICVLIRNRTEAAFIEEELDKREIPHAFYKKPGLFTSSEAVFLGFLFHAVLNPGDDSAVKKALLTPFFGIALSGIVDLKEMPPVHPVKRLLFKWHGLAARRRWSRLYRSMLEDSGLLARETGKMGWDRKQTNYRQIFEYLEDLAHRENLDFRGVSAALDVLRKESARAPEEAGIHQIETESGKVQIMTMHVSKGLQFPVVFVAGGLTGRGSHSETYHIFHETGGSETSMQAVRTVDLTKSAGEEKHRQEQEEENKRLLYVAATRAQIKLYLPFYLYEKRASWLGPVCTLLSPALLEAFGEQRESRSGVWLTEETAIQSGAKTTPLEQPGEAVPVQSGEGYSLFPAAGDFRNRRIRLESFSSLHHKMGRAREDQERDDAFQAESPVLKEPDEGFAQESPEMPYGTINNQQSTINKGGLLESPLLRLPGGIDMGLLFHDILELLDYRILMHSVAPVMEPLSILKEHPAAHDLLKERMALYRIDPAWKEAVWKVVCDTLTAPVFSLEDRPTLAQIPKEDRRHEMEFYYPFPIPASGALEPVEGIFFEESFIRGFVDVIFQWKGKFYIADWKSNLLETGYEQESMERSMTESQYHLQYRLYAVAAMRWLKQAMGNRFNFSIHFGGVFYFYLRGMEASGRTGIYYVPPERLGTVERLEKETRGMVAGCRMSDVRCQMSGLRPRTSNTWDYK